MSINTFGEALKFGMKLEKALETAYEEAAEAAVDSSRKELFEDFAAAGPKHRKLLESIYSENTHSDMDSGVLAPIKAMQEADYSAQENKGSSDAAKLEALETAAVRFYKDFLEHMPSVPRGVRKRIQKMHSEHADRHSRLAGLHSS
jgi:rubrerythrin